MRGIFLDIKKDICTINTVYFLSYSISETYEYE